MPRTALNVYNYLEPEIFFQDLLAEIRSQRPEFSTRAWCKKLGVSNSGSLSKILKGTRPAPMVMTSQLAAHHGLTPIELAYLQALCVCAGRVPTNSLEIVREALKTFNVRPNAVPEN